MANPEHVAKLKEGVEAWNEWLSDGSASEPDLSGARFKSARLNSAQLSGTNLCDADLTGADLRSANLGSANLSRADLTGANFVGADLSGANLTGAIIWLTVFGNTNLTDARLENCLHAGWSVLDHATLAKSGMLPLAFLRGCGLQDNFIDFLPSLLSQAIQFYSCFISYSTKDQEFASRLYADLQKNGVRCWFAPHNIAGGKKIHEQIDEAIRMYDRLLLILSEHSMRSDWVKTEIAKARKRELNENRRMLFPVSLVAFQAVQQWECFDADTGKDSAREVREYFIPDFSNWKNHDCYKEAFDRLLHDLETKERVSSRRA